MGCRNKKADALIMPQPGHGSEGGRMRSAGSAKNALPIAPEAAFSFNAQIS